VNMGLKGNFMGNRALTILILGGYDMGRIQQWVQELGKDPVKT
jgi:hypothetical protein